MSFFLRDAVAADIPSIAATYRESVLNGTASYEIDPPTDDDMSGRFARITGSGYPYLAAEDDAGSVIGYAYASAFRSRPAYRWMVEDSIYLAPGARGLGIGKALLAALLDRSTALGFRQMVAVIGGAHPASVALHRAAGFAETGLLIGTGYKHGKWLDTMLMQKALGDGNTSHPDLARYPATLSGG
ncbi:MAG: N-acetyltransferase family protein [Rhizobium sp.]